MKFYSFRRRVSLSLRYAPLVYFLCKKLVYLPFHIYLVIKCKIPKLPSFCTYEAAKRRIFRYFLSSDNSFEYQYFSMRESSRHPLRIYLSSKFWTNRSKTHPPRSIEVQAGLQKVFWNFHRRIPV